MADEKSIVPEWGTPEKVWMATEQMQKVETRRATDRARINNLANGCRPYTEEERKKFQIQVNVNWLELSRKVQDATGQINNAFIPDGNYFTCFCETGEPSKRVEYGQKFTKCVNDVLKRNKTGKTHHFLMRSRNASVSLHGIGVLMWPNSYTVLPKFIALEDLLIPTDTYIDFSNLTNFAINFNLTPGELYKMAFGDKTDPGWKKDVVRSILMDLKDASSQPYFSQSLNDWSERPEAISELFKQNSGFMESDAVPKVKLRSFYYQDPKTGKWYQKIILRDNTPSQESRKSFVYSGTDSFANDIGEILHVQFGDNSLVAPLKYHSVRGIGVMLYAACETINRLRCQAVQHIFQNMMTWFKVADPADRDRLKQIILSQYGVMPEGASIVPQTERHQIDSNLLQFGMAQMKQNISENSSSFTQNVNDGTSKQMTAFEAKARLQSSNAMVSNVLQMMYAQELFYYEEIVKRLLRKNGDNVAESFKKACIKAGIPEAMLSPENWKIVAERVLGAGDNMLAQAQADQLMSQRMAFEPDAQRDILRTWASTTLNDPERASQLVPPTPVDATDGTFAAEDVFATLMMGIPVHVKKGIDHVGYCVAMIQMMQLEIKRITEKDGVGIKEDIDGLITCADSISQHMQIIAANEQNKAVVKEIGDTLGQLMNEVKAFSQRQQEAEAQAAAAAGPDLETQAKAQSVVMLAQTKAEIAQMTAEQKMQHKQQQFEQQISHKAAQHEQDLATKAEQIKAELIATGARTGAQIAASQAQADAAEKKSSENP